MGYSRRGRVELLTAVACVRVINKQRTLKEREHGREYRPSTSLSNDFEQKYAVCGCNVMEGVESDSEHH